MAAHQASATIEDMRRAATSVDDRAVVVTRTFDAPRTEVFRYWSNPQKMALWFAPEPLTVPRAEIDFRVGGRYTLVMRDLDGNEFPSTGTFREIVEPELIVYTDSLAEMPDSFVDMVNDARGEPKGTPVPDGVVTVTLDDMGDDKTRVTFRSEFDSKATRDAFVQMQMVEGLNGSFDNLEGLVGKEPDEGC